MWVERGCRGRFRCGDTNIVCGFKRQPRTRIECSCLAGDWPTEPDTLSDLERLFWRDPHPVGGWLGAIISGSSSSARYRLASAAVASCGFRPAYVPAAKPADYENQEGMLLELFGDARRRVARMSPFELGVLVSHKRALALIARSNSSWGAVFEDDAYLHEAIRPSLAARLFQRVFAVVDSDSFNGRHAGHPVLYLGGCDPRCDALGHSPLPIGLLRVGHCRAYCAHAYALSRSLAGRFFADIFGCHSSSVCGRECEHRPCFMDSAMVRHFQRGNEAWVLGGGLRSRWAPDHRGIFMQNRSTSVRSKKRFH